MKNLVTVTATVKVDINEEAIEELGDHLGTVGHNLVVDTLSQVNEAFTTAVQQAAVELTNYRVKVDGLGRIGDFTISVEPR